MKTLRFSKVSYFAKSLLSVCSFRNYTLNTCHLLGLHLCAVMNKMEMIPSLMEGSISGGKQITLPHTHTHTHTHTHLSLYLSVYLSFICLSIHSHDFTLISPIPVQHYRVYLAIPCTCKSCEKPGSHCPLLLLLLLSHFSHVRLCATP